MSTTTITPDATATTDDQVPAGAVPHIELIDPATVVIEDNIRFAIDLDDEFVGLIKEYGVLIPVLAHPSKTENRLIVRDGQRRILAAQQAGLTTVPAYVVDADDTVTIRILEQLAANMHKRLTEVEQAHAWHQLHLEGMTPTAIARKTRTKKATVEQGIQVASDEKVAAVVTERQLTLDQGAALLEFESDKQARATLLDVAARNPGGLDHALQRARDDRDSTAEVDRLTAHYTQQGVPIIEQPGHGDRRYGRFDELRMTDGAAVTEANYAAGLGHVVAIVPTKASAVARHYVQDWKEHGLRNLNSSGSVSGPMTEQQKAERRTVIENNRAWDSAETVRREFVTNLLGRKALPKDALLVSAAIQARHTLELGEAVRTGHSYAHELLGLQRKYGDQNAIVAYLGTNPTQAVRVHLALVLAALESSLSRNTWRHPTQAASTYLFALRKWGYTAADVEHLIPGGKAPLTPAEKPARASAGSDKTRKPQTQATQTTGAEKTDPNPVQAPAEAGESAIGRSEPASDDGTGQ